MRMATAAWGAQTAFLLGCMGGDMEVKRPSECNDDPSRPGCRRDDSECLTSPKSPECLDREYFRAVVKPIFAAHCEVCHQEGGLAWGSTGLSLAGDSAWDNLVNVPSQEMEFTGTPMTRVRPGMPESSYLFLKISMPVPPFGARMPLTETPLTTREIAGVREWIEGRPND